MTIENARVLQEQLANEAIAHLQENGSKELADDCVRSIAVVGKAWGIPADETAHWQARAQQEQTRHVGDAGPRETMGTDEKQIDHILDGIIDFGDDLRFLELSKRLCRHIYYEYPQLVGSFVHMYRALFEEKEDEDGIGDD